MRLRFTEPCCNKTFEIDSEDAEVPVFCPSCKTPLAIAAVEAIQEAKENEHRYDYMLFEQIFGRNYGDELFI